MDIVLIPAYEPDETLIGLTDNLKERGFGIVVVDDGSGEKYAGIFERVAAFATVVTHDKNRGKGAALKTGMRYICENIGDCENFITCDADGQHKVCDVVRVAERLHSGEKFVLTVRTPKKDIPFRSKFGNGLSRFVYALLTNRYLSDNQSGLRGYSISHIDWLIEVEKENYDYEMNILYYAAKKSIHISTLPIEALYIDNNSSSHFNPLVDTLRIYNGLFWLARGTLISFFVAELLVLITSLTIGYADVHFTVSGVGAIACLVAVLLNRYIVFKNTPCYDYWSTVIYTVISYFVYTLCCMIFMLGAKEVPLFISFNITYIACIPLRYCLHKFIFIASRSKE